MTRRELKRLLETCDGSSAGLKRLAAELRAPVLHGVYKDDPLGLYILEARAGFRRT
ncbi:MAG TPA: hypothetical protein VK956_17960 [Verrucomicrobium sp.]|nr:hypothetical protein [Verrucomicrobium sp.]